MTNKEKYKTTLFQQFDPQNNGLTEKELINAEMKMFNGNRQSIIRKQLIDEGFMREKDEKYYFASASKHNKIIMSDVIWTKCSVVAASFANSLFTKVENCEEEDLEHKAAHAGYEASVNQTDAFKNSISGKEHAKEREEIRNEGEMIIADFLKGNDYAAPSCFTAIEQIRNLYRSKGVINYTYGNAQKWVNMAIKYYIFIKSCYIINKESNEWESFDFSQKVTEENRIKVNLKLAFDENERFNDYELFAVDSIMIKTIKGKKNSGLKIGFAITKNDEKSWSKCDNFDQFKAYWENVKEKLDQSDEEIKMPFLWEVLNWKSRDIYFASNNED